MVLLSLCPISITIFIKKILIIKNSSIRLLRPCGPLSQVKYNSFQTSSNGHKIMFINFIRSIFNFAVKGWLLDLSRLLYLDTAPLSVPAGRPRGRAEMLPVGFLVTGRPDLTWSFSSGANNDLTGRISVRDCRILVKKDPPSALPVIFQHFFLWNNKHILNSCQFRLRK